MKFILEFFFFPPACFSLVTFPRNLAQIFRRDRPTYVHLLFGFYAFEVTTYFVVEKIFLNKYLATLFEYDI